MQTHSDYPSKELSSIPRNILLSNKRTYPLTFTSLSSLTTVPGATSWCVYGVISLHCNPPPAIFVNCLPQPSSPQSGGLLVTSRLCVSLPMDTQHSPLLLSSMFFFSVLVLACLLACLIRITFTRLSQILLLFLVWSPILIFFSYVCPGRGVPA